MFSLNVAILILLGASTISDCDVSNSPKVAINSIATRSTSLRTATTAPVSSSRIGSVTIVTSRNGSPDAFSLTARSISRIQGRLFFSWMQPLLNSLRLLAKRALESYNWYYPELQFGKCLVKYAKIEYPELLRNLRVDNVAKAGQALFMALMEFTMNMLNTNQFVEVAQQGRIGVKGEQMTRSHPNVYIPKITINDRVDDGNESTLEWVNKNRGSLKQALPNCHRYANTNDRIMYAEPRQLTGNAFSVTPTEAPRPKKKMTSGNATSDLSENDEFDLELIILEGLGINPASIKRWSPTYCIKDYTIDVIKRMAQSIVLA